MRRLSHLNGLRAFEAAARHRSFALAAEELSVTPAAISQQIKTLEQYLGVVLFRRVARGVVSATRRRPCCRSCVRDST
jgi:LysR family glycine cleavage system transcriptional activator